MLVSENPPPKEEVLITQAPNNGVGPTDALEEASAHPKEPRSTEDQASQDLPEDDSVSQSVKPSAGMFLSSSESAFASTSTAVTVERKEELLAQARADRLEWIRKVPLPYKSDKRNGSALEDSETDLDQVWERDPRLAELKKTFVVQQSPSAVQVLSHLYGLGSTSDMDEIGNSALVDTISQRVGAILDHANQVNGDQDGKLAVPTAEQIRSSALAADNGNTLLSSYHSFVTKLVDPATAVLVQGMRSFCGKIRKESRETLPPILQGYLRMTFTNLKEYAPWKDTEIDEDIRRSFESFVYGHLVDLVELLYWTKEAQEEEKQWQERLGSLQFVTPKHLEISCLAEADGDYQKLFEEPVEALLSMDKYFAPFEKLQRILKMYHGVNAALTRALNPSNDAEPKKLPSADDVLPSIILVVLLARPANLLLNLLVIEELAPPEYLRGEAGYAFTNLYGAVQFLKDMDLDADKPSTLNIDVAEFQKSLQSCRQAMEAKLAQRKASTAKPELAAPAQSLLDLDDIAIPVSAIREARIRGEVIDMDWARSHLADHNGAKFVGDKSKPKNGSSNDDEDILPSGFTRSYSFLHARPEDIRLADLPQLLTEYKMLVRTTEALVGEKIAKANAKKKAELAAKQREVYEAAKQMDPTLLPPGLKLK